MNRDHLLGMILGMSCALIWGVQAVVTRQSVMDGLTTADVTALRFVAAGIALLPVALRQGRPFPVGALGWPRALVLTVLAGAPYSFVIVAGAHFAPAFHIGIISPGMIPVFATFLAWVVFREAPRPGRLAGLALFGWQGISSPAWRGDLIFVGSSLMWATYGVVSRRWRVGAIGATAAICVLSMISVPLWVFVLPGYLARATLGAMLLQAVYQGLVVGALSLFLYTRAVALIGPVRVTLFLTLIPLIASVAGGVTLGEWPSAVEAAGMAVAMGGMVLSLRS